MALHEQDVIVIGGGAAGYFCAVNAARLEPGLKVTILEKSNKVLAKVRISGGGRCNVTHACFDIADMIKRYPRGSNFVKKTFYQFFTTDTIEWFLQRGVKLKQEADGRMFPVSDSSQTIIDCLTREAGLYGVQTRLHCDVRSIRKNDDGFAVECADGRLFTAPYICIASGGYPKASMFDWITAPGHSINDPVPSLFTLNIPKHPILELMGVSVEQARVRINGTSLEQTGPLLITHWGLSGPVVLRTSAWGARLLAEREWKCVAQVNWIPSLSENELREKFASLRYTIAAQKVSSKNHFGLPARLWEYFLREAGVKEDTRWSDLPAKDANKLIRLLNASEFNVQGKTTYKEEFVTAGGVKPGEVDAGTMMSRQIPGLFFAGEVLDVDGITGGFNFQHAWTSGYVAAKAIASMAEERVGRGDGVA
ncbi:MAG: NAD(P)/FAD-dependent oxidoreductase [Chitinophagaceae bacterium]|nr:MAG: NAD(P)/FAD-dependent oxidoreductase [Chitinophagaceae bacterium]